eukprot:8509198-Alexandrium_andersonii.AAC.1
MALRLAVGPLAKGPDKRVVQDHAGRNPARPVGPVGREGRGRVLRRWLHLAAGASMPVEDPRPRIAQASAGEAHLLHDVLDGRRRQARG